MDISQNKTYNQNINDETKSIILNNGLTDSIRNMIKLKDQCHLERNDLNMSKILGTLYLLIKSFYKTNITWYQDNITLILRVSFRMGTCRFWGFWIYHSICLDELITKIEILTFANAWFKSYGMPKLPKWYFLVSCKKFSGN